MKPIPSTTPVILTAEEWRTPEARAGSGKSEARMRGRVGIVLLATPGPDSRAVAREVGRGTRCESTVRAAMEFAVAATRDLAVHANRELSTR
jgi:uncharacterized membrane protein